MTLTLLIRYLVCTKRAGSVQQHTALARETVYRVPRSFFVVSLVHDSTECRYTCLNSVSNCVHVRKPRLRLEEERVDATDQSNGEPHHVRP